MANSNGLTLATGIDLLTTTLDHYVKGTFTQTLADNNAPACEGFFGSGRLSASGGAQGYRKNIRLRASDTGGGTKMYATQSYQQRDVMGQLAANWVIYHNAWIMELSEMARNRDPEAIVDTVEGRRDAMFEDVVNYFERRFWQAPDASDDDENPQGIPFWIAKLGSGEVDTTGGHNGTTSVYGDGTTTTSAGGIDRSQTKNLRSRNWAGTYDGRFSPALKRLLTAAVMQTSFRAPKGMRARDNGERGRLCVYWSQQTHFDYMEFVNSGPDDMQGNAMRFWDGLKFGPIDLCPTPRLNNDPDAAIYGINHKTTKVVALRGEWMVEDEPSPDPERKRTITNDLWCQYCVVCESPRDNFVIHTPRA